MALAVTNRVRLGLVREATPNTTPATPAWRTIRPTGASLAATPKTVISDEIISDRQVSDLILVGQDIGGGVDLEFSAPILTGDYMSLLLEAALQGAWVATSERSNSPTAGQITAVAATTYTTTAVSPAWQQDDVIKAQGFTNAANNKIFVAGAASSSTSIVHSGGTVEASPPTTARLKKIGFQARTAADIQATTAGAGPALTATTMNFTNHALAVGQWVKLGTALAADATSFATAANNGWCRISGIAATRLDFDIVPAGFATDTAAGKTVRVYVGDYVRNGTTDYSHSIEQAHLDITQFEYFTGMRVGSMAVQVDAQAILKGSFGFMGQNMTGPTGTRFAGSTDLAASTTDVLNSSANVGRIAEAGTPPTTGNFVMKAALTLDNNLRAQVGVGQIGAYGIGSGRCTVQGTITAYFSDGTMLAKVLAGTASSFDFNAKDAAGNTLLFDCPRVKFSTGTSQVPGIDQDVMIDMNFQALKHATLGYTLHVQKFEGVNA